MVYMDHAATTPVDPLVLDAMLPYLTNLYANPSSVHAAGRAVRIGLDAARDQLAAAIHCEPAEVCFTSGGTEADNLAVRGVLSAGDGSRDHLVISAIEHHAVLDTAAALERTGVRVTVVEPDHEGIVGPERVAEAVTDHTALVSVMHGNNEIGSVQDIARIAHAAHERGALFHSDCVQSFGQLPIHLGGLGCDLASFSAHKLGGPKGVGALFVRAGTRVGPMQTGGGQERGRRPGTENVAGIIGFGEAAHLAAHSWESDAARMAALRDRLISLLERQTPGAALTGARRSRLPNNVHVTVPGVDGALLVMNLDREGVAASSGAACSSGALAPSHVLRAVGVTEDRVRGGLRLSLGRTSTEEDVIAAADAVSRVVRRTLTQN